MRILIIIMLICFSCIASAANIACYSSGHLIYSGIGIHPEYMDGIFSWKDPKTKEIVFISADCIIKVK